MARHRFVNLYKHLADLNKHNKEVMINIKEKQMELEQNERILNEVSEQKVTMERRMTISDIEVEELRVAVEKAEKQRKTAQGRVVKLQKSLRTHFEIIMLPLHDHSVIKTLLLRNYFEIIT